MKLRAGRARHRGKRVIHNVGGVSQFRRAKLLGLHTHFLELVVTNSTQNSLGILTGSSDQNEVAQALENVFDKLTWVLTGLNHTVDGGESGR